MDGMDSGRMGTGHFKRKALMESSRVTLPHSLLVPASPRGTPRLTLGTVLGGIRTMGSNLTENNPRKMIMPLL